jgi:hypothetical protein
VKYGARCIKTELGNLSKAACYYHVRPSWQVAICFEERNKSLSEIQTAASDTGIPETDEQRK